MIFKNLFKPKWKNSNPLIRRQVLREMDANDAAVQAIFAEVVRDDSDPVLRQWVVKQLRDLALLATLAQRDSDATVREHAGARLRRLVAGLDADSPTITQRLSYLDTVEDSRLLDYVVHHAPEVVLREHLMRRLAKESLCAEMAVEDPDSELRLKALGQVTSRAALERVLKNARNKDKRIRQAVQERLQLLQVAAERPAALKQQAKQLCIKLDAALLALKVTPNVHGLRQECERLKKEWTQITGWWQAEGHGDWDTKLDERYQRSAAALEQLVTQQLEGEQQQAARVAALEPLREEKRRLLHELRRLQELLENPVEVAERDELSMTAQLTSLEEAWRAVAALPELEERHLAQEYDALRSGLQQRLLDVACYRQTLTRLEGLLAHIEQVRAANSVVDERVIKNIEKQAAALNAPQGLPLPATLVAQLERHLRELRQTYQMAEQSRQAAFEAFATSTANLEAALDEGQTKQAAQTARHLHQLLRGLDAKGLNAIRERRDYARYQRVLGRLRELRDWQGWAANPVREELCVAVEQLANEVEACSTGDGYDFEAASKRIQGVRQRWKALGPFEEGEGYALWERFNNACNRAYEPCQKYFAEQSERREQSLAAKRKICGALELYYQQEIVDHALSAIDWRRLDRVIAAAQQEWNSSGSIKRKDYATVRDRFNCIITQLRDILRGERLRNHTEKAALIDSARKIATSLEQSAKNEQDIRGAIAAIKRLQTAWKEIGYASDEKELWGSFRDICDQVFGQRQAQFDFLSQERQSHLDEKVALCALLEALANNAEVNLPALQAKLNEAQAAWLDIGSVSKSEQENIEQRFTVACRAVELRIGVLTHDQRLAQQRQWLVKDGVCDQLEQLLDDLLNERLAVQVAQQRLAEITRAWHDDTPIAAEIGERFQRTHGYLTQLLGLVEAGKADTFRQHLREEMARNLQQKEELCLRMEIVAGVDSPPQWEQARMALQVQQLAKRLGHNREMMAMTESEAEGIYREWLNVGPIATNQRQTLAQRFQRAHASRGITAGVTP